MTTDFDSFDESSLGGFTESPLGARNGVEYLDAIVFIDESSPYIEQGLAGAALVKWDDLLRALPTLSAHVASVGVQFGKDDIWPSNVNWPGRISHETISREPSDADIDSLFRMIQRTQLSIGTPLFYFKVDISGSMVRATVEPALRVLRERLDAIGRRSGVDEFPAEDWLDVLHNNLRQDMAGAARIIRFIGRSPYDGGIGSLAEEWARLDLNAWNTLWNDDVTQQTIADHNLDVGVRLMHVPVGDPGGLWPSSVEFPPHVEVVNVGSSVSQTELNAMYASLFHPIPTGEHVRLYVRPGPDGILGQNEIGLVQDQLQERLANSYSQLDYSWDLSFARWLEKMTTEFRQFIDIWRLS